MLPTDNRLKSTCLPPFQHTETVEDLSRRCISPSALGLASVLPLNLRYRSIHGPPKATWAVRQVSDSFFFVIAKVNALTSFNVCRQAVVRLTRRFAYLTFMLTHPQLTATSNAHSTFS